MIQSYLYLSTSFIFLNKLFLSNIYKKYYISISLFINFNYYWSNIKYVNKVVFNKINIYKKNIIGNIKKVHNKNNSKKFHLK